MVSALYALFVYHFNQTVQGEDATKVIWKWILATLFFAIIVIGVGVISKSQRNQCIPKTVLVDSKGNIPDPAAYINFHSSCADNKLVYDEPAKEYIMTNHHQPSWIMSADGHTSDPVGWWNYYSTNPKNPYQLNDSVKKELFTTYYLPKEVLIKGSD
jgi:hypothetical protein